MRKILIRLISLVLLLLLGAPFIYAQEATVEPDAGWPVEERCVGAPTKPPKDWSYDGTILMTGERGIHAMRSDWETTHVVSSIRWLNVIPGGAGLSPDGKWYAVPWGSIYAEAFRKPENYIHEIRVFSTESPEEFYRIDWDGGTHLYDGLYLGWPEEMPRMMWRDNKKIIYLDTSKPPYDIKILDFKSGESRNWNTNNNDNEIYVGYSFYPSSDWSRAIYNQAYGDKSKWGVYESFEDKTKPIHELAIEPYSIVAWLGNSQYFIAQTDVDNTRQLRLFDKNGDYQSTIFSKSNTQISTATLASSADGRYLGFAVFKVDNVYDYDRDYYEPNEFYIADLKQHTVINTCLSVGRGIAWSPDSHSIAFLPTGYGKMPITVLNMDQWQTAIVGYLNVQYNFESNREFNEGSVIGWRTD
jgi:hypothetical protein